MLKREWGAESNGNLPHPFIPSKSATLVPEFAVGYLLPAFAPALTVKDLPLGAINRGRRVFGISGSLIWSKSL